MEIPRDSSQILHTLMSLLMGKEKDMEDVAPLIIFTTVNGNCCQIKFGSENALQENRIYVTINVN